MATLERGDSEEVSLGFDGGEEDDGPGNDAGSEEIDMWFGLFGEEDDGPAGNDGSEEIDMGFGLFGEEDDGSGNDAASEEVSLNIDGDETNGAYLYMGLGDEDYVNDYSSVRPTDYSSVRPTDYSSVRPTDYSSVRPADELTSHEHLSLDTFVSNHVAEVAKTEEKKVILPEDARQRNSALDKFVHLHVAHAASSRVKVVDLPEDYTQEKIEHAFRCGRKEQLLNLLEYGIDIFAPLCIGSPEGKEGWLLDFYGTNEPIARDLLMADKDIVLKAYRKQKWKISLVGGSVAHWNRRRHFVAFLERYVINLKNTELRERAKDIFSIVLVQSVIMAYL